MVGDKYHGYDGNIDSIRDMEYPHLNNETYLDHAGTAIYARSLVEESSKALLSGLYGNPHSKSPSSERTTDLIHKTRLKVLEMVNADPTDYDVVLTANTTAAVKLVGEGLSSLECNTRYTYLSDSHTSLVGLRNLADDYHPVESEFEMEQQILTQNYSNNNNNKRSVDLISWPCQSNFSGKRYPTKKWLKRIAMAGKHNKNNTYTLIDAAAISSTCPPDLSNNNDCGPDFVVLSFYKIFGLPDLGALIINKRIQHRGFFSNRVYFGGGTVESLTVSENFSPRKKELHSCLEDGTLPFHSILTLSIAFDIHYRLYGGFDNISNHTAILTQYLYDSLRQLLHHNGQPLCVIYGVDSLDTETQGPIISFNLKTSRGEWIGYSDFESVAASNHINIRTGTLCNTGSTCQFINLSEESIIQNHANGHICGDDEDVINGLPTGVIRASLGACSSVHDVDRLVQCLTEYYLDRNHQQHSSLSSSSSSYIGDITLYPIKSCAAFHVPPGTPWEITKQGLKWDREFCLVDRSTNSVLALKKHPRMALIKPHIDETNQTLTVYIGEQAAKPLTISLQEYNNNNNSIPSRIMGEAVEMIVYDSQEVIKFFSDIVGVSCTLARFPATQDALTTRYHKPHLNGPLDYDKQAQGKEPDKTIPISMNNSSPLLLISKPSTFKLALDNDLDSIDPNIFRGNIVISGKNLIPYSEDSWKGFKISRNGRLISFKVSQSQLFFFFFFLLTVTLFI